MIYNKNNYCKTLAFWLSKITYLFNLWKTHDWNILQMHLCLQVVFLLRKVFSQKVLPSLVERMKT
jgi:hypothetical protein